MPTLELATLRRLLFVRLPGSVIWVLQTLAVVATLGLMCHVVANALLRTFANDPVRGTLEYVQYWYVPTIALFGFVVAQGRRAHIEASLVYDRVSPSGQVGLQFVTRMVALAVTVAFTYYSLIEAVDAMSSQRTAGSLRITAWPVWFAVPLAFGLLSVAYLSESIRCGWAILTGRPPSQPSGDEVVATGDGLPTTSGGSR